MGRSYDQKQMSRIGQVQKRFLKFLKWKKSGIYPERGSDVFELHEAFDLLTFEESITIASILFIVKILRGCIDV